MKIAVCDDSPHDLSQARSAFDRIKERFGLEVCYYGSGEEVVAAAENGAEFSLAVLDVYMGGMDGIAAARRLREVIPRVQTAFLTSSRDFAVDAFDLGALHYVVKPVTAEKLNALMERFFERSRFAERKFELKSKSKTYELPVFGVMKVISSNKGVDVCLKNGETIHIPVSFSAVEEQLDGAVFLKISRGLIVNMSYILCMTNEVCRLKDGTEALISRKDKSVIRRKYNDYLFEAKEDEL